MKPNSSRRTRPTIPNVIEARNGMVLGKETILKVDHFHSESHWGNCDPPFVPISGAANFRGNSSTNVYAVAQPTIYGIKALLNHIGCTKASGGFEYGKSERVLMVNLREEPIIYVNRRACVLRPLSQPFRNLVEYSGINANRIEEMEWRLKADIIREARQYGGNVVVHQESNRRVISRWEAVEQGQVLTPLEVYQKLRMRGYDMRYARVPFTPLSAPSPADIDLLSSLLATATPDTHVVFVCHTGGSRSSLGMVLTCLLHHWRGQIIASPSMALDIASSESHAQHSTAHPSTAPQLAAISALGTATSATSAFTNVNTIPTASAGGEGQLQDGTTALPAIGTLPPGYASPLPGRARAGSPLGTALEEIEGSMGGSGGAGASAEEAESKFALALRSPALARSVSELYRRERGMDLAEEALETARYRRGLYDVIAQMLVTCGGAGQRKKAMVDYYVRSCGQLHDFIDAIWRARHKAQKSRSREKADAHVAAATQSLERYFLLLAFNEYLSELAEAAAPGEGQEEREAALVARVAARNTSSSAAARRTTSAAGAGGHELAVQQEGSAMVGGGLSQLVTRIPFSEWLVARSDLSGMLRHLRTHTRLCLGLAEEDGAEGADLVHASGQMAHVLRSRAGVVLSPNRILKEAQHPGLRRAEGGGGGALQGSATAMSRSKSGIGLSALTGGRGRGGDSGSESSGSDSESTEEEGAAAVGDGFLRGAVNFHSATGLRVHGVCTPTLQGINGVLHYLAVNVAAAAAADGSGGGGSPGGSGSSSAESGCVLWINLRESPLVYIDGSPYVLRRAAQPFRHMPLSVGVKAQHVELLEKQLKEDVIAELTRFQGKLLLHDETADGTVTSFWKTAHPHSVLTPREVYESLPSSRNVRYCRVPMAPGAPPSPSVLATLLDSLRSVPTTSSFVFNCQLGLARSTTAMVVACMYLAFNAPPPALGRLRASTADDDSALGRGSVAGGGGGSGGGGSGSSSRRGGIQGAVANLMEASGNDRQLRDTVELDLGNQTADRAALQQSLEVSRGDVPAILDLLRVLRGGAVSRKLVNLAIDMCSHQMNLRRTMFLHRDRASTARTSDKTAAQLKKSARYLGRYFNLILLGAYLHRHRTSASPETYPSLDRWIQLRPEFGTLYHEIFRDPKAALQSISQLPRSNARKLERSKDTALMDKRLRARSGAVLNRDAILKFDHFPGCQRFNLRLKLAGAPNFRTVSADLSAFTRTTSTAEAAAAVAAAKASGDADAIAAAVASAARTAKLSVMLNISGTAMPTVQGVVSVLHHTGMLFAPQPSQQQAQAQAPFGEAKASAPVGAIAATPDSDAGAFLIPATPGGSGSAVGGEELLWINLREEPILYLSGRPFVLRQARDPIHNLEYTGINRKRVERMEVRLKTDVLTEAAQLRQRPSAAAATSLSVEGEEGQKTDGAQEGEGEEEEGVGGSSSEAEEEGMRGLALVHDEGADGGLVAYWEAVALHDTTPTAATTAAATTAAAIAAGTAPATAATASLWSRLEEVDLTDNESLLSALGLGEGSVCTPRELYTGLRAQGLRLQYVRIPITDEQAPKAEDLEQLVACALKSSDQSRVVINCQMGRGRTTTGMVVFCLVRLWRQAMWAGILASLHPQQQPEAVDTDGGDSYLKYRRGEYQIILSLVRVLPGGVQAKQRVDVVIDACSVMQNLREAILNYKLKVEDVSLGVEAREYASAAGLHYLRRYFWLVVMSAYLLQHAPHHPMPTFSAWTKERPELDTLLQSVSFD